MHYIMLGSYSLLDINGVVLFYKLPILMSLHDLSGSKFTLNPNQKTLLANNKGQVRG